MNTNLWQNTGANYSSPYQPNYYANANQFLNNFAKTEVVRVNGKNGAEAYQLAPNSSALLVDSNMPIVWFVQTDGAGYKTCTPYKIEPYQPEEPANLSSLEARIKKLEDLINGKPNNQSVESATNNPIGNATVAEN